MKRCLLTIGILILLCLPFTNSAGKTGLGKQQSTAVTFSTDTSVETMYYILLLADYPLLSPYSTSYKNAALRYFKPYRSHKAVLLAKSLFDKGFVYGYPVSWLYKYSSLADCRPTHTIDYPFDATPISADSLAMFRTEMQHFYKDASCEVFLKSQEKFLAKMLKDVSKTAGSKNIIAEIEHYFGVRKHAKWRVVISPLLHSGGYTVERKDVPEMYALIGPGSAKDSLPVFDQAYLEQDLILHEFSHNYSNSVVEKYMADTKKYETTLYPSIKKAAHEEGYSSWESFMYELAVRTTTIRIARKIYGTAVSDSLSANEKTTGFVYAITLAQGLEKYEKERKQYPTFADYFPELLKIMGDIKPAK